MMREPMMAACLTAAVSIAGCGLLTGGGTSGGNGDGAQPGGDGADGVPVVRLSISNPNPGLGEEVVLACSVQSGGSDNTVFAFQPADGRLIVNTRTGRAIFIVEATDLAVVIGFTCTATNENGTSQRSNRQEMIPTA